MAVVTENVMPQHIVFHDCAESIKDSVREYWHRKWPRLERLLTPFPNDQRHLRVIVNHHPPVYDVRIVLMLSTGTLVAEGKSHGPNFREAIDIACDHLVREIKRHKELLRHDYLFERKRRRRRDVAGVRPALEAHRARHDRLGFSELLRPALRGLAETARRELVIAQLEGHVRPGELTVSDLLDEVIAQAYERYNERPLDQSFDQWLTLLLYEVLDYRGNDREIQPTQSLHQPLSSDDPRFRADSGWVQENEPFWDQTEPLTLEQILPSEGVPEPWHKFAAEEQRRWLLSQLRSFPRSKRRAFTLVALDGWDADEVANVQGRPVEEVRRDLEEIRETLRTRLGGDSSEDANALQAAERKQRVPS